MIRIDIVEFTVRINAVASTKLWHDEYIMYVCGYMSFMRK